jgi:hypothetical protein
MMTWDQVRSHVDQAVSLVIKNDAFLLDHAANERSITHKLAEYLQQEFPQYHVDCEYNKHGVNVKRLPRRCNQGNSEFVYPDIVVHLRGNDNHNVLVIEAKPRKYRAVPECDRAKLEAFTESGGGFRYQFGLFIGFNKLSNPQYAWFEDGKEARLVSAADARFGVTQNGIYHSPPAR